MRNCVIIWRVCVTVRVVFHAVLMRLGVVSSLFVYAWNRRQLYRQQHPGYPAYLINFVHT